MPSSSATPRRLWARGSRASSGPRREVPSRAAATTEGEDHPMSKPAILKSALRTTYALSLAALPHRTELPYLLNRRGLLGAAVEVGVKAGEFSEWILERWHGRLLISVDPWGEYSTGTQSIEQSEQERLFRQTKQRLARFGGRSDVWRVTSLEAATRLQPASLDFIYIDARHEYNHVRDDIEA